MTARGPMPTAIGRVLPMACGLAAVLSAAWAFRPLQTAPIAPLSVSPPATDQAPAGPAPLEIAAFRAPLWVAPPAPPAPPPVAAAPPPAPPLKLQLIAILRDGKDYKATLYDPDTDKLHVVGPGDVIAGGTIERVGAADVSLRDHGLTRTLSLRSEGGAP